MKYLRSLFATVCAGQADIEARSLLAFSLAIGNHFIAADHIGYSRAEALELALNQLLNQPIRAGRA